MRIRQPWLYVAFFNARNPGCKSFQTCSFSLQSKYILAKNPRIQLFITSTLQRVNLLRANSIDFRATDNYNIWAPTEKVNDVSKALYTCWLPPFCNPQPKKRPSQATIGSSNSKPLVTFEIQNFQTSSFKRKQTWPAGLHPPPKTFWFSKPTSDVRSLHQPWLLLYIPT